MKKLFFLIYFSLLFHFSDAQEIRDFPRLHKTSNQSIYIQNKPLKSSSKYQQLDSAINFTLSTADTMRAFLKETFEYDENGNLIRNVDYRKNSADFNWKNDIQWEFQYNSSNLCTVVIITKWDTANMQWENRYSEIFEYDELNNKTQSVYFKPDSIGNTWVNDYREVFMYDSNSNLTEHWYFLWDSISNQWLNDYKIVYHYDASGNRIKSDFFKADLTTGNWLKDYKSIFTHNDNNLLINTFHARWDTIRNLWSTDYQADYTYDALGNRIQNIYSRWDRSGKWLGEFREEYLYNDSSLMTGYYLYAWNALQNNWDNLEKKDFSYPCQVEQNLLVLPRFFYEEEGKTDINALASSLTFDWDTLNSAWKNSEKRILYFSDFNGIINASKIQEYYSVRVYPNPVSNILYIEFATDFNHPEVELYNASGNLVLKGIAIPQIDVTEFPRGFYFLKISGKGKYPVTRKIIVN